MIEFIAGNFAEKTPSHVVVEANGIGYLVHVSLSTYEEINVLNAGKLLIHYSVSVDVRSGESKHQLYGFSSSHERQLFRQLITVSGVSSSISSTILSAFKAHEIQSVIVNGDSQTLTTVKGVGPKLAQKIVGELREKLAKSDFASDISKSSGNSLRQRRYLRSLRLASIVQVRQKSLMNL